MDEVSSSKIKDISIEQEQLEKLKQYNQKKARKKLQFCETHRKREKN